MGSFHKACRHHFAQRRARMARIPPVMHSGLPYIEVLSVDAWGWERCVYVCVCVFVCRWLGVGRVVFLGCG